MATLTPSNRTALRTLVVLFLGALVLAFSLPDIRRVWQPAGDFGYWRDDNDVITAVYPDSPASHAGLKIGDRIDIASMNPADRELAASGGTPLPGQRVVLALRNGTTARSVTMVSEPETMGVAKITLILVREFALFLFVGIGAALVLLRPSITTWAFYAFCLGFNGAPASLKSYVLGPPWGVLSDIVSVYLIAAGAIGIAVFAAAFLREGHGGWRWLICRWSPFAVLVLWGLGTYRLLGSEWFGWPAQNALRLIYFLAGTILLLALFALVDTYIRSEGTDRQRIRWVVLGFGIVFVARMLLIFTNFNLPYWFYASLSLVSIVVPLTVAYSVIKHRVIDVSFVVSRALVYGILTTALVGLFSVIDWFFIDKLKLARLGTIAEVGAAIGIGFWFNSLHRRVDSFIDATFFRQRRKAEVQLARNAAALPSATTTRAVAQALVKEPVRTLSLASGALFRRGQSAEFFREESEGWMTTDLSSLDDRDSHLLMLLQAENGPLSLYDHPWRTHDVPSGPAQPVLALPIIVRRELAAIVFYGAHTHGEALDPDEIKAIASLAPGAAAAYDHLEAEKLRNDNESVRRECESLRARLAEAQVQSA